MLLSNHGICNRAMSPNAQAYFRNQAMHEEAATALATATPAAEIVEYEEFVRIWIMDINQKRIAGKPEDWDGKENGFDAFVFKFTNWLDGLPGNAKELLDYASVFGEEIPWPLLGARQVVMAHGIAQALQNTVNGKALDIVESVKGQQVYNGFEMWGRLTAEYLPQSTGKEIMPTRVGDGRPPEG